MKTLKQPYREGPPGEQVQPPTNSQQGTEAFFQEPCAQATLESDPPASVKASQGYSPGNLMSDSGVESLSKATPKFLTQETA